VKGPAPRAPRLIPQTVCDCDAREDPPETSVVHDPGDVRLGKEGEREMAASRVWLGLLFMMRSI
jgi:hypothetical protein